MNEHRGPAVWIGLVTGLATLIFGTIGLIGSTSPDAIKSIATWVVGADLLHDLVLGPVLCIVGLAFARVTPAPWRLPVRSALLISAAVLLVAYPALRGYGRHHVPDNHSVLPLNYTTGVATILCSTWGAAIIWGMLRQWRARRAAARARTPSTI